MDEMENKNERKRQRELAVLASTFALPLND